MDPVSIVPCSNSPIVTSHMDIRSSAVVVRNATKNYGKCKVIDGLNMTIRRGTIYSFLGSSGCGKTTTLECIVGLNKFTSGKVLVFGEEPGSRYSHVPGKSVGYMPQDYSLYAQLSISETLMYFGTMNGMDMIQIYEAMTSFRNLLQLPKLCKSVSSLSGGEKRRVSLVVAVMHNPPLLILDEPTVGMDPLLCQTVLKYLTQLARQRRTTVLITTHYTEAARHSDTIGVMRNGKLIAEKSPQELLQENQEVTLESVILKLSKAQSHIESGSLCSSDQGTNIDLKDLPDTLTTTALDIYHKRLSSREVLGQSFARIRALVKKNTFIWQRSFLLLYISLIFPAKTQITTYYCFDNPKNVNLGVVNEEISGTLCEQSRSIYNHTCAVSHWSCKYLDQLKEPEFILHNYDSIEEAEKAVKLGNIWGFIFFPSNFSDDLYLRSMGGGGTDKGASINLNGSSIIVHLDKSNTPIALLTEFGLLTGFAKFLKELFEDCNMDSKKIEYSLNFKEPIFGKDMSLSHFAIAPLFLQQMLFLPVISTGLQFVSDRRQGTIQRAVVAGTQLWEIFLSYAIVEFGVGLLRLVVSYEVITFVLGMELLGSRFLEGVLCLLVGCVGMGGGFLLGLWCTEEAQLGVLALGLYFPNILLSGMFWPMEGMPEILRKVSYFLPVTLPAEAIRSMVNRDWGLDNENVWLGFVSASSYFLIVVVVVIIFSRKFKS